MAEQRDQTENYHLPLYTDSDKPNLRDQYGRSMDVIDTALTKHDTQIGSAQSTADNAVSMSNEAKTQAQKADTDAQTGIANAATAQAGVNELDGRLKKLGVSNNGDADTLKATISAKADKTYVDSQDFNINAKFGSYYTKTEADNRFIGFDHSPTHNPNIVALGDSWGQGFTNGDHPENSPSKFAADKISAKYGSGSFTNASVSATGFAIGGQTFEGQWAGLSDTIRHNADVVIVLGGQNDATTDVVRENIHTATESLIRRILNDAPKAEVHIFPMALVPTTQISMKRNSENPITMPSRMKVLAGIMDADQMWGAAYNVYIHKGVYRWSMLNPDTDAGDGAHLTANGYQAFGALMANTIINHSDIWPFLENDFSNSELGGDWHFCRMAESNGISMISFSFTANQDINSGARVTNVPTWLQYNASNGQAQTKFFNDGSNDGGFYGLDNALKYYGPQLHAGATMNLTASWPAGM